MAAAANAAKAAFSSATLTSSAAPFVPRQAFEVSDSIVRSYFLGHHNAALSRMRRVLSNVQLVIECRDIRVPITSWNPLLESSLMHNNNSGKGGGGGAGRARIVVYTKRDLLPDADAKRTIKTLARFHASDPGTTAALFHAKGDSEAGDTRALLAAVRRVTEATHSLTGTRALVVGMPNAGKSTLLNRLRAQSTPAGGSSNVARTGAEPGVTRKMGTPVRILPADAGAGHDGAFLMDTPGVFVPYVADVESMLKLALVGCVKDGLISWITVADYLLFHLNRVDPSGAAYAEFCDSPTNDVHEFLASVARRTGKLGKGNSEFLEGAADWVVRRWRTGRLGKFLLDEVTDKSLAEARSRSLDPPMSINQARKREKEARKAKAAAKQAQRS